MTVLLVDGVGTAVGYARHQDTETIVYRPLGCTVLLRFHKTPIGYGGCDVYRLHGTGAPRIRDARLTRPFAA